MKLSVIYKVGLIVMIALNVVLIFLLVQKKPPFHMKPGRDVKDRIINELGLDKSQQKKYNSMAQNHHREMMNIENQEKKLLKEYFSLLSNDESLTEKEAMMDKIKELEARKLTVTYDHFDDLKKLLNPNQMTRFNIIIEDITSVFLNKNENTLPPPRNF